MTQNNMIDVRGAAVARSSGGHAVDGSPSEAPRGAAAPGAVTRGPAATQQRVVAGFRGWRARRETYQALMRCSDRILADMGIERDDIPLIARGIDPSQVADRRTLLGRWWQAVLERLTAASEAHRERARVREELMAYSDHELDDLGVRRTDIPVIARGGQPAPL